MIDTYSFWIGVGTVSVLFITVEVINWLMRRARENMDAWKPKHLQEYTAGSDIDEGVLVYRDKEGRLHESSGSCDKRGAF